MDQRSDEPIDLSVELARIAAANQTVVAQAQAMLVVLQSFRSYYADRRDALNWIAAFSVAGLFATGQIALGRASLPGVIAAGFAVAVLAFFASLLGAVFFYATDLRTSEFKHETEIAIGELLRVLTRGSDLTVSIDPQADRYSDPTEARRAVNQVQGPVSQAAERIASLGWPHDVSRRTADRSWAFCAGGFVFGLTIIVATEVALVLSSLTRLATP